MSHIVRSRPPRRHGLARAICAGLCCFALLSPGLARAGDEGDDSSRAPSASLNEEIVRLPGDPHRPVTLETTIFKPSGPGPFPLAVMLHGATKASASNRGERYRFTFSAYYFLSRGYEVALPMARGFAKSGGTLGHVGCASADAGLDNAADVAAAITELQRRPDVDRTRVVVAGQSFGGWTAMAYGTAPNPGVRGLIGFSPAFRESDCAAQDDAMIRGMGRFGSGAKLPAIWFFGDNDTIVPVTTWRAMYSAFRAAGGRVDLVQVGRVGSDSHQMLSSPENLGLWVPRADAFLARLGLPSAQTHPEFLPSLPPPASHFAAIDNVDAVPADPKGRDAYRNFLTRSMPRAFAVTASGGYSVADGGFDPAARAVAACGKAGVTCRLYAVDNDVVWVPPPPAAPIPLAKTVAAGRLSPLAFATAVNADCSPKGVPALHVLDAPAHGTAAVQPATGHPHFGPASPLAGCNTAIVPGAAVTYLPVPGFAGADALTFEEVGSDGGHHPYRVSLTVQ